MPTSPTPPRRDSPPPASRVDAPPSTSVEAVRSLARVARLLERATGDLGLAQYRVLSALASGEDRASRVAKRFELGRPAVSSAVDVLTRAGLIEQSSIATDQRAVSLRLTARGRAALAAAEDELVRVIDELCRRLPSPEVGMETLAGLGEALDGRAEERHALSSAPSAAPRRTTRSRQ